MLIKCATATNISGSIAGNYFQRDNSGLHIKSQPRKIKRTNTSSLTTTKIFLTCVNAWRDHAFTAAELSLWGQYARRHPRKNAVGDSYILTVQLVFYQHNFIRVRNALPIIYTPPAD